MQDTINALAGITTNRNNCYVYRTGTDGYIENYQATAESRDAVRQHTILTYPSNTVGTYKYTNVLRSNSDKNYGFKIYHQPAFLMQTLAGVMGGEMPAVNFALLDVAPYLEDAKWAVIRSNIGGIEHPHYTESYYLLAGRLR